MRYSIDIFFQDGMRSTGIRYILNWMFTFLRADLVIQPYRPGQEIASSNFVISYGVDPPLVCGRSHLHIAASDFFFPHSYLNPAYQAGNPIWYGTLPLAFPSVPWTPSETAPKASPGLIVPDILASAFFLITRYEEYMYSGPLDSRDRFTAGMSWMGCAGLLDRPLADEYRQELQNWIKKLDPTVVFLRPNWQGNSFAIALSRDIDSLQSAGAPNLLSLARSIRHGKFRNGVEKFTRSIAVNYFHRPDPHNNLQAVIEWERSQGIHSSINLMSSHRVGDANYRLDQLLSRSPYLLDAQQEGWELGFHPGVRTSRDEKFFQEEYQTLTAWLGPITGGRQHTLRFRIPETWRYWERAGLQYDSSLGFADREGFRCGTCFPYLPFDLEEDRVIQLWEIPLTAMDNTFTKYRQLSLSQIKEALSLLLAAVKQQGGVYVLLWHNTFFGREIVGEFHDVLVEFFQTGLAHGAWVGPLRDVLSCYTNPTDG